MNTKVAVYQQSHQVNAPPPPSTFQPEFYDTNQCLFLINFATTLPVLRLNPVQTNPDYRLGVLGLSFTVHFTLNIDSSLWLIEWGLSGKVELMLQTYWFDTVCSRICGSILLLFTLFVINIRVRKVGSYGWVSELWL